MSVFALRSDLSERLDPTADVALDWAPRSRAATIHTTPGFLAGLEPSQRALDLFVLGAGVYCVDKLAPRADGETNWDREHELRAPVHDLGVWEAAAAPLTRCLDLLSGDRWRLRMRDVGPPPPRQEACIGAEHEIVCLLSGGLDSLCGAIELLEGDRRVVFVAHHDGGAAAKAQKAVFARLRDHYGTDRAVLRQLHLGPASPHPAQAKPPPSFHDPSSRARSFLFITAALVVADGLAATAAVHMPENGFIGVNVPLTPARHGTLSTRTTHPAFLRELEAALHALGLAHPIVNAYRLQTKGEALAASSNPALLRELIPLTLSCAHPEAVRWSEETPRNCGYCYPCLIRRAALHAVNLDEGDDYAFDILDRHAHLITGDSDKGADTRAVVRHLTRPIDPLAAIRNAAIPLDEIAGFTDVYRRGRAELHAWLIERAGPALRRLVPA